MSDQKFNEYKMIVDESARFSERRQGITNTYITVNSLLLTAITFMYKDVGAEHVLVLWLLIALVIAGGFVCIWWYQLIMKYKRLVGLRMNILYEMENSNELSWLEKIYHKEEEAYYPRDKNGNMVEDKSSSFSNLESKLPIMFGVLYAIFGIVLVYSLF